MVPVPEPPLWPMLLKAVGITILAAIGSFVLISSLMACFMLFLGFGLPRIINGFAWTVFAIEDIGCWSWRKRRQLAFSALVALITGATGLWQWYFFWDTSDVPDVRELIHYAPPQIGYIYDRNGSVMVELANVFRKPVSYDEIPISLEWATIAAEDKDFYQHDGIPVMCMDIPFVQSQACLPIAAELVWRWVSGKGGSTLTMQLARNHYLADMMSRERGNELVVDNRLTQWLAARKGVPWVNRRVRKLREIKYALHMERQLTDIGQQQIDAEMRAQGFWWPQRWWQSRQLAKRRAKELLIARYLSTVYYGYSMYGPDSASRFFFNKAMTDMTVDESALLASLSPAPSRYAQLNDTAGMRTQQKRRRNVVLRRMGQKGFIASDYDCGNPSNLWDRIRWFAQQELPRGDCRDDVAYFSTKPVSLVGRFPGGRTDAPASVQMAMDEIESRGFSDRKLFDGAIRLYTTVDMRIQDVVNKAAVVGSGIYRKFYEKEAARPQIAIVVLRNRDAAVLAQFGGYTDNIPNNWTHLDRSRKSIRQPGSIFKIFVYLATLAGGGHTPDSLVNDDGPYRVRMGGGAYHFVHDYHDDYKGWMCFREAVAQSRNVPAMHVGMEYTTLDRIIATARDAGITTPLKHEPSIILGSGDITVMELANAYRALFAGVTTPYVIERVTNSFGEELSHHESQVRPLHAPPEAVVAMQELLRGGVELPSGTGHQLDVAMHDIPVACKTGTSNRFADARITCATYGPEGIVVSVWTGFDDSTRGLGDSAAGGRLALPIAQYILEHVYRKDRKSGGPAILPPPEPFPADMERRITNYIEKAYPK